MMKKILVTVIAFILGLTITTYVLVKKHKSTPLPEAAHPADSTAKPGAADSVQHAAQAAGADSTAHKPDSAAVQPASTKPAETTPPAGVVLPPVIPGAAVTATHSPLEGADPAEKAKAYKEVARIFSSMKAAEAAKVLGLLNDTEVEGILRAVGPRQAADFMINLPKERAAALSRRLLVPKPAGDSGAAR